MAQKGLLWLIGLLLLLPTSDSQQSQGRPAPTTYAEIARLTFSDADNKPFMHALVRARSSRSCLAHALLMQIISYT